MSMISFHCETGEAPHRVEAHIVMCGCDVSVAICGGTRPHIGAGALAVPRPGLRDPEKTSASASVICVVGHKEDLLAKNAAEQLAAAFGRRVSVCAGLHIDQATDEDIKLLQHNCELLLQMIQKGTLEAINN
jgi:hypothetical protein